MADHWTYRDGVFTVTGWHARARKAKATPAPPPAVKVRRGVAVERPVQQQLI